MAVTPTRNLPPEAEPWGRFMEAELKQIKTDVATLKQMVDNTLLGVNGALKKLGDQVAELNQTTTLALAAATAAANAASQANAAVAELAQRITVNATAPGFNTGGLSGTGTMAWFTGNQASLTLDVPTGKMLVTVTCGEASLSGSAGGMGASISYAVPTAGIAVGGPEGRNYTSGPAIGSTIVVSRVVNVTPGVHTVQGVVGAYSFTAGASVNFNTISLTVQVIV